MRVKPYMSQLIFIAGFNIFILQIYEVKILLIKSGFLHIYPAFFMVECKSLYSVIATLKYCAISSPDL